MWIIHNIFLYSSGRDRVLILWDLTSGSSIRVIPVYEEIEDTFIIPKNLSLSFYNKDENAIHIATAGEKGLIINFFITYYKRYSISNLFYSLYLNKWMLFLFFMFYCNCLKFNICFYIQLFKNFLFLFIL